MNDNYIQVGQQIENKNILFISVPLRDSRKLSSSIGDNVMAVTFKKDHLKFLISALCIYLPHDQCEDALEDAIAMRYDYLDEMEFKRKEKPEQPKVMEKSK